MQRNHLFNKASGLHYYRRTTCRDIGREMNRSARRKMLRVVGIIMVVMLPVMLALWFAQLRAVSETSAQLRTFAELALDKTELVIQQVDLARAEALWLINSVRLWTRAVLADSQNGQNGKL